MSDLKSRCKLEIGHHIRYLGTFHFTMCPMLSYHIPFEMVLKFCSFSILLGFCYQCRLFFFTLLSFPLLFRSFCFLLESVLLSLQSAMLETHGGSSWKKWQSSFTCRSCLITLYDSHEHNGRVQKGRWIPTEPCYYYRSPDSSVSCCLSTGSLNSGSSSSLKPVLHWVIHNRRSTLSPMEDLRTVSNANRFESWTSSSRPSRCEC